MAIAGVAGVAAAAAAAGDGDDGGGGDGWRWYCRRVTRSGCARGHSRLGVPASRRSSRPCFLWMFGCRS